VVKRRLGTALGLLAVMIAAPVGQADARSPFDGRWHVMIRSLAGPCASSGRYSLLIRDGLISYGGLAPIDVRGRVDRRGHVMVQLNGGDQFARGAGRLFKASGSGTWRGRSRRHACSGRWWAERR
jgi:hypothetical protein